MLFIETQAALDELGEELVADVIASQRKKGLRASGRSAASTRKETSVSGRLKTLRLYGLARWRFQESGRGPGKFKYPSKLMVDAIREWVKDKGLTIPAYAIAMKINRDGIRVPNQFNPGGVLSEPLGRERVIGLAKTKVRPALIKSAKSLLFS